MAVSNFIARPHRIVMITDRLLLIGYCLLRYGDCHETMAIKRGHETMAESYGRKIWPESNGKKAMAKK
jgi:hypothetical protein